MQVGDGRKDEALLAKHQRFITAAFEIINTLTLAPQSGHSHHPHHHPLEVHRGCRNGRKPLTDSGTYPKARYSSPLVGQVPH